MRGAPVIVPINLGCCTHDPRCLLCPPPPPPPGPELVEALIHHYRTERASPDAPLQVGFYGGAPPTPELLEACGGLPFVARIRPDLLSRRDVATLVAQGAIGIELDVLTFRDEALRSAGRRHRRRLALEQIDGLRSAGLAVGVVLAIGLPSTSHSSSVDDALLVRDRIDSVRLHPVLVLAGARLREAHMNKRYEPLSLGSAITTCQAMLELLEPAGVQIIRVGQNPAPDGLGRAVAGPYHPSLRQLVDARRVLEMLHRHLRGVHSGARIAIRCHPADETQTRGPYNQHIRTLRAAHDLEEVRVEVDPDLSRGELAVDHVGDV